MEKDKKILIYACGNPCRQDDGLGISFCNAIDQWIKKEHIEHIDTDSNYQFNIEDASTISHYDTVIFVDASCVDLEAYKIEQIEPDNKTDFSMHHITPRFVLFLAEQLFNAKPDAYVLQIKGYTWDLDKEMTQQAKKNLDSAVKDVCRWLKHFNNTKPAINAENIKLNDVIHTA